MGRANQDFCSNAHKAKAFRWRRQDDREKLEETQEPYFIHASSLLSARQSTRSQLALEPNVLYQVTDIIKKGLSLAGKWEAQDLRFRGVAHCIAVIADGQ